MISRHLNPRWPQRAQNGNYTTLLTKAAAPDHPFNTLYRGSGQILITRSNPSFQRKQSL